MDHTNCLQVAIKTLQFNFSRQKDESEGGEIVDFFKVFKEWILKNERTSSVA
jgi:hypothetical protein